MNLVLRTENFDWQYLDKSFEWLQNPELLFLIASEPVSREAQEKWFLSLPHNPTYKIWGVSCNNEPFGVCGIRSIDGSSGELFCYIGDKKMWGGYWKSIS